MKISWTKLVISVVVCQAAGGIGAIATTPKINGWYSTLNKPFFNPPGWIFGPVWTLLFVMMGVAMYLVWQKKKSLTQPVFGWFWVQLILNVVWSYLFFGMMRPDLALIEILFLWWAIRMTIKSFAAVGRTPVRLLIPYLAWVSFATILNASIWWLNRA